jgi:hypothetical protein
MKRNLATKLMVENERSILPSEQKSGVEVKFFRFSEGVLGVFDILLSSIFQQFQRLIENVATFNSF